MCSDCAVGVGGVGAGTGGTVKASWRGLGTVALFAQRSSRGWSPGHGLPSVTVTAAAGAVAVAGRVDPLLGIYGIDGDPAEGYVDVAVGMFARGGGAGVVVADAAVERGVRVLGMLNVAARRQWI